MSAWTLADVLALEDTRWPERHRLEADLAAWLRVETRAALDRNRHEHRLRQADQLPRIHRYAQAMAIPPDPQRLTTRRRAILAGRDEDDDAPGSLGERRLIGGVWRWSAA